MVQEAPVALRSVELAPAAVVSTAGVARRSVRSLFLDELASALDDESSKTGCVLDSKPSDRQIRTGRVNPQRGDSKKALDGPLAHLCMLHSNERDGLHSLDEQPVAIGQVVFANLVCNVLDLEDLEHDGQHDQGENAPRQCDWNPHIHIRERCNSDPDGDNDGCEDSAADQCDT